MQRGMVCVFILLCFCRLFFSHVSLLYGLDMSFVGGGYRGGAKIKEDMEGIYTPWNSI